MLLWSERRGPRAREVLADVTTLVWLALWTTLGIRLYSGLSQLAGTGRLIQDGGNGLLRTGGEVAQAIQGVPLLGEGAAGRIRDAFGSTAQPIVQFGSDMERLLLIVAALLGLIVVAIAVIPWLNRYVPWRVDRIQRLNAGARAIRRGRLASAGSGHRRELEQVLASRALHRLDYDELLEFTPDPLGDWVAGRFDRLVRAELDEVGLARVLR